jgi:protein-serine/threonine kinase
MDLFNSSDQTESRLPSPPEPNINKGTVRIYARSLHLSKTSFAQDNVHPSVITVERAALCQVFLETKYQKTFQEPSEREIRRQTLESLVCQGKELTPEQRDTFNQILKSVESEWSRLSRVRPSIDAFKMERKLGSGGFGVVNMVTEKETGNVYAMKVIR